MNIRDITLIAALTAIIFVQEELLTIIPNVQLTVFLLVLYSKKVGFKKTSIIILIHTLLDNLVMGSFNMFYIVFMFIGWMIIPLTLCSIFKNVESNYSLAFLGILFSFCYCFVYIVPNVVIADVKFLDYLYADIIFEVILAMSSFISILLLYNPISKFLDKFNIC